ncbi:HNH endonuclease [Rhodococcus sp. NPDC060176]|uniref:HNH endonuclease n=1 Tax=Rhodococcus sp. NPDC060176 TaxID=3347062 RepID=UPI0036529737
MTWNNNREWATGSTRTWRTKRAATLHRDNYTCTIRGRTCTDTATEVDHILGKAEGGTDAASNLRSVCKPCHQTLTSQQAQRGRATRSNKRAPMRHPGLG